jgi:hypothetical protein
MGEIGFSILTWKSGSFKDEEQKEGKEKIQLYRFT